jgi:hypothetical protein
VGVFVCVHVFVCVCVCVCARARERVCVCVCYVVIHTYIVIHTFCKYVLHTYVHELGRCVRVCIYGCMYIDEGGRKVCRGHGLARCGEVMGLER